MLGYFGTKCVPVLQLLLIAAGHGNLTEVELLIGKGASVGCKDTEDKHFVR